MLPEDWIAVLPTDTIYGICGSALDKRVVERIYKLRKRNLKKPMIVLIGSFADLGLFGIELDTVRKKILKTVWPGPFSVALPLPRVALKEFAYLHRGTKSIAFRLPKKPDLITLLKKTGPIVAPSANIEGEPVALTIEEAQNYFGDKVNAYVAAPREAIMKKAKPSTLISIINGTVTVLRQGAGRIPKNILR